MHIFNLKWWWLYAYTTMLRGSFSSVHYSRHVELCWRIVKKKQNKPDRPEPERRHTTTLGFGCAKHKILLLIINICVLFGLILRTAWLAYFFFCFDGVVFLLRLHTFCFICVIFASFAYFFAYHAYHLRTFWRQYICILLANSQLVNVMKECV